MKHLSLKLLSDIVVSRRKVLKLSQTALSQKANINRSILSRLEAQDYSPSVDQLLSLCAVLGFQPTDVIVDDEAEIKPVERKKIAVAGTGYVGLSLAVLLSQHNDVTAVDIVEVLSGELDDGGTGGIFGGVFTFQVCDGHFIQRITAY